MFVCPECGAAQAQDGACPNDRQPLVDRGEDLLLGQTVGAYRIARLLGLGGMGRVYKGVHPQIGSRVAIKVLSRECADRKDLVDRFFAEARAVNLIRHESIVNVLDLSTLPDGRPYIVMEYLDGAPLAEIVGRLGALPLGGLARLATEVLDALGAAHTKGIVHRDLKPDNIYVAPSGRPKVLDFGIAKLLPELGGTYTQTGSLLGTPHYMAPEQALGKPVDHRTDIYAMGVIVYECATGRRPFHADSLFDLLRKHVDEVPVPPHQLRPDLPPAMESVILTAMAKDPNQRFGSAVAMAQALMQSAQTLPQHAWTPVTPATTPMSSQGVPSGARFGSGAAWAPSPMPPSPLPPTPQPPTPHPYSAPQMAIMPTAHVHGMQPPHGQIPTAPQGYAHQQHYPPPPPPPPPPHQGTSTTATAGQVMSAQKGKPSGSKRGLLFALLAVVLVGGGVTAGVLLSRGGDDKPGPGPAPGGSAAPVAGGSGAAEPDVIGGDTPAAGDDSGETAEDDTDTDIPDLSDIAPSMGGGTPMFDKRTLDALRSADPKTKAQMLEQIRMAIQQIEQNLKNVPKDYQPQLKQMLEEYKKLEAALSDKPAPAGKGGSSVIAGDPDPAEADDPPATGGGGGAKPAPSFTGEIHNAELSLPSGFDPKRADMTALMKVAIAWAKKNVDPDARLYRIDADGVMPDGYANLTIDSNYMLDYRFISPARAKRPDDVPLGVKVEYWCYFRIWVTKDAMQLRSMFTATKCDEPAIRLPTCTAGQVWKTAIGKGAPGKNAIGEMGYRAGGGNKPTWYFDIDDVFSEMWPDDC